MTRSLLIHLEERVSDTLKKCLKNGESLNGIDDVRPLVLLMIPVAPVVSEATERIRDTSLVVTQKTHEL